MSNWQAKIINRKDSSYSLMKYDKYKFSLRNFVIFLSFSFGFSTIIHTSRPESIIMISSKLLTINEDVFNPMSSAFWLKGILVTFILIKSMTNGSKS